MNSVANFITIIRNGYLSHKDQVISPATKFTEALASILVKEGFIKSVSRETIKPHRDQLIVELKYVGREAMIEKVRLISKPGLRVYVSADKMPGALGGMRKTFISTSKGIMSGEMARKSGLGGEVICEVIRGVVE